MELYSEIDAAAEIDAAEIDVSEIDAVEIDAVEISNITPTEDGEDEVSTGSPSCRKVPELSYMKGKKQDLLALHKEYFDVFNELELQGPSWRRKKGKKGHDGYYSQSKERLFSRLKLIALAVEKVKLTNTEEDFKSKINSWDDYLKKTGVAPLVTKLQNEGVIEKGRARKKKNSSN